MAARDELLAIAKLASRNTGRAVVIARTLHLSIREDAFIFAPLKMAGEERLWAAAFGARGEKPRTVCAGDARNIDDEVASVLHPVAQANLADLFIDVLNARENGQSRGVQLIVETHSEHFLNRLQRRIAEASPVKSIRAADVACYFARTNGTESVLEPLQMDIFGNIQNWPPNFFGDTMGDLMEMQRAAAQRRANGTSTPTSEA